MAFMVRLVGLASVLLCWPFVIAPASAVSGGPERIISYHSEIQVYDDASMEVLETIEVQANGQNIKRGIYRDFPTKYRDRFGNKMQVKFEVLGVARDGRREPWHQTKLSNGYRVYIGSEDRTLRPGVYKYSIRYVTDRQLGYFADHDELYWNVTGNGWAFPITKASAVIKLPGSVVASGVEVSGYTGPAGSRGTDYQARTERGRAYVETTVPLRRAEGLTVAVSWPKGHVFEPSDVDRFRYLLMDNRGLLVTGFAFVFSALFLFVAWSRVGKDPEPGIVFAHYAPPEGHSPASAHYLSKMGYSSKTFSAAVISLAVKGHLKIVETALGFSLRQLESDQDIAPGEAVLRDALFENGADVKLEDDNHELVAAAQSAHRAELSRRYKRIYFKTNSVWLLVSGLGSVIAVLFAFVWNAVTPFVIGVIVANVLLHMLFAFLLKAPTNRGRELLDELEGFELYLSVAEQKDLELAHPPKKTPELFERFLPYALALGVENAWADQFVAVFESMRGGQGYRPNWYVGPSSVRNIGSFSSNLGSSLSSAISSASTPPGSSSGGGGGGFSGGGGGGGGGGGW